MGGLLLLGVQIYRRREGTGAERVDVDRLGLELRSGCCALVVFTTPTCRPCKVAVAACRDAAAAGGVPTEVRTVDATEHADLALRYDVRAVPTIFLITASGRVVRRWRRVPERGDLEDALALI